MISEETKQKAISKIADIIKQELQKDGCKEETYNVVFKDTINRASARIVSAIDNTLDDQMAIKQRPLYELEEVNKNWARFKAENPKAYEYWVNLFKGEDHIQILEMNDLYFEYKRKHLFKAGSFKDWFFKLMGYK